MINQAMSTLPFNDFTFEAILSVFTQIKHKIMKTFLVKWREC